MNGKVARRLRAKAENLAATGNPELVTLRRADGTKIDRLGRPKIEYIVDINGSSVTVTDSVESIYKKLKKEYRKHRKPKHNDPVR